MSNLKDKIRNEVIEKAKGMDEADLEEWLISILSEIKALETKCEVINRILVERHKEFLKNVNKQN